jgi:Starch-binding associating with outer membrane
MKKIIKIVFLFAAAAFVSCDENLDINTDPNSPGQISKGLALTSAQGALVNVIGGDLMNLGGFFAQYHTQAPVAQQYISIDQYNLSTTYADRIWPALYAGTLNDLKYIIDESDADGDTGSALIAEALRAYTFQLLVDLFGDVPYFEALQGGENITPAATSGEEIYADLIERMDAAMAAYDANPVESEVGAQDAIYGGDMDKWIQFSNTLKLKMYMRMSYTSMADPAAVNALLAEGNFLTEDAAFASFGTGLNQRHPFYEVQIIYLNNTNNVASSSLHEFYVENADPRLEFAFTPGSSGSYSSILQGSGPEFDELASTYSRPNIKAQTPVFLMTVAESNFLQAEGLIRYAGGTGAKDKYDDAVRASFSTYQANFTNVDNEAIMTPADALASANSLIGPGGAYEYQPSGDAETTVRQVMVQKWAAMPYINNIEAYIETTRTKFPEVVAEDDADYAEGNRIPSRASTLNGDDIPSILYYPSDEVNRNPNITQRNSLTENVWWDQKPE